MIDKQSLLKRYYACYQRGKARGLTSEDVQQKLICRRLWVLRHGYTYGVVCVR